MALEGSGWNDQGNCLVSPLETFPHFGWSSGITFLSAVWKYFCENFPAGLLDSGFCQALSLYQSLFISERYR